MAVVVASAELAAVGLTGRQLQNWSVEILAAVQRGLNDPLVKRVRPPRPDDLYLKRLDKLKEWRKGAFIHLVRNPDYYQAGRPYVDISFMPENALELDRLARENGVTAVVDCGIAPGVSNMMVGFAAAELETTERVEIYVGGLPVERRWPFDYKAGFAPSDVLEEYVRMKPTLDAPQGGRMVVAGN